MILERVMSNKKSSTGTEAEEEKKKARNLHKALTNDSESVFYATNKITLLKTFNFGKNSKKLII